MYYDGDCTSLQKEDKSYYGSVQDFKENCNGFFIKASASGGSTSGVSSVAGKSGDVTLTKNDVGLSNVNNTSDLDKPISTETQRILNDTVAQVETDLNIIKDKVNELIDEVGEKLELKDFQLLEDVQNDDLLLMSQTTDASFAAAMTVDTFRNKVLKPLISEVKPNGMSCEFLTDMDAYNTLLEADALDARTMYIIITDDKISNAFLGKYEFSVGSGGGTGTGDVPVTKVFLDINDLLLELGDSKKLTESYEPYDATSTIMSWSSSNKLVATVTNGLVTSVGKGNCIIKVRATSGAFGECLVTVEVTMTNMTFGSENDKLIFGESTQLVPTIVPANATVQLVYSSSNDSTATVDQAGLVTPVADTGTVTITAVNKNNVTASIPMTIVPFAMSVSCAGLDKQDNSVESIFSKWTLTKRGNATHYKFTETIKENGVESVLQSVDWTLLPVDGIVDIELYAEFGNKFVNWTFKNASEVQEAIVVPVFYKEPELITYSLDIDVKCSAEQAALVTMDIPYYKYDKKFVYCLRNDDNLQSLWRNGFRYVNREWNGRIRRFVPHTNAQVEALSNADKLKAPRRLGYTNGCGTLIPFSFDTAGQVQDDQRVLTWGPDSSWNAVRADDILKHKDYGGHFILHNMSFYDDDPVKPRFPNDYSYPLQRDRQIIFDNFGYTSVSYANPDGDWWYTIPCIKDPKTLLFSGNSTSVSVDPNGVYGRPAHRKAYNWNSDLSDMPLSEIRNTMLNYYIYNNNQPYTGNLWKTQYQLSLSNKPTLAIELTHGFDHEEASGNADILKQCLQFFDEIYDVVGANGTDTIWICSQDEVIEYLYYQRAAKITKTAIAAGHYRFNIQVQIPDYLSFKTYSAMLRNLPSDATVTYNGNLTSFSKNLNTGLINFGYSPDTYERANRYVQKYLSAPTKDNLDNAWHFTNLLGELKTDIAMLLPPLNEKPVISSVVMPSTLTDHNVTITITNSNKEYGEANKLEVSQSSDFSNTSTYLIAFDKHKYFDPIDETCKQHEFNIQLPFIFNQSQTLYFRLANIYGTSNVATADTVINRIPGVNDPIIVMTPNLQFKYDDHVECNLTYQNITDFRYKVDSNTYTEWLPLVSKFDLTLTIGQHTIVVQGRNDLEEIVEQTVDINYTGIQRIMLFGNVAASNVDGIGYVNAVSNANTKTPTLYDLLGNSFGREIGKYYPYNKTLIDKFRSKYGITIETDMNPTNWSMPNLTTEGSPYPNTLITGAGLKLIQLYGGSGTNTGTGKWAVKYITELPTGQYTVKLLLSIVANANNVLFPNTIRVQNETITIPIADYANVVDNNSYWYTFSNVTVDADGYMFIGQTRDEPITSGMLSPIVLIEITKL